jgi:hypothetical protein
MDVTTSEEFMKTKSFGSIYGYYYVPQRNTLCIFTPETISIHVKGDHWLTENVTDENKQEYLIYLLSAALKISDLEGL